MFLIVPLDPSLSFWDAWLRSQYYNPLASWQAFGTLATVLVVIFASRQFGASKVQQFESTFFKLIDLHYTIIKNLNCTSYHQQISKELIGTQVFEEAESELYHAIKEECQKSTNPHENDIIIPLSSYEQAKEVFEKQYYRGYYNKFEAQLNHYFRNLYHVLKYVDKSDLITKKQRHFYASILRAQLSQNQLYVWLFNAMQPGYGYPNVLYLIARYDMLKNFRHDDVKPQYYWEMYNELRKNVKPLADY